MIAYGEGVKGVGNGDKKVMKEEKERGIRPQRDLICRIKRR